MQFSSGVTRRLGPAGSRWWQLASHWSSYLRYLEALERELNIVRLPGVGQALLSDSFVPLRLRPWDEPADGTRGSSSGHLLTLAEALAAGPRVLAVGPAGTGKSAVLRSHAVDTARQTRQAGRFGMLAEGGPSLLPVYLGLASAPGDAPLEETILASMQRGGFEGADEFLAAHLESGHALVLVDDLDTVRAEARQSAAGRVTDFARAYPECRIVVATRDVTDRVWLPGFRVLDVVGIDPGQVETLTRKWGYEQLANTSGFLQVVERSPLVRSLVARPGWLAAGLAGVSGSDEPCRAFDIVDSFVRHLDSEAWDQWGAVALRLQEAETTVGSASDLPPECRASGLLQWLSPEEFRFVHIAVQAYFAASQLAAETDRLVANARDAWWEPVIVLAVGFLGDAGALIDGLVEAGHTTLAGLALAETREPSPALVERVQSRLLETFGQTSTEADRAAAIALAGLVGVESVRRTGIVSPVLAALANGTEPARRAAAAALGRIGDPSAIPALLNALGDEGEPVRRAASEALAAFGERTVQPLVRQLSVPNAAVRNAAIGALSRQGERAVAALIPLLEGTVTTARSEAAEALAALGTTAVPSLVDVLRQAPPEGIRSESVVEGAADALTRIGGPAAVALVPLYAEAGPVTRRRIVSILRDIGPDAVDRLGAIIVNHEHPNSGTAAGLVGELPNVGPAAAGCLIGGLSDPRFEVRWEARRSLRRLGNTVLSELVETLQSTDPEVRWAAAQILMALPEPPLEDLLPVLTEMLDADDVAVRRRAVRALGMLSGARVRLALEHAAADVDPLVRRSAIAMIGAMADPEAIPALVDLWSREHDEDARLALLEALVSLDEQAAIPVLIDGLAADTAEVKRVAAELLADVGESAVVPLVEALNSRPAEVDLVGALQVLERAGAGARASGHTPANLARTYHRMLVEPLEVDELVYLATTIEWWRPAYELHRTFSTARRALQYTTLGGIGSAETELEWIDEIEAWLRPAAQRTLRQLRSISQAIQYYNRGATRQAKEKGLLAAAHRLNTLRDTLGELGEPHTRVFHEVAEHWNTLINAAIRELQGRAELDLEIRNEHVRIRDGDTSAVLVLELVNRGEGLASNVQMTLTVDPEALTLQSAPTYFLPPLGHSDRISSEYTVRRSGAGIVPITVEAKYDDPQGEGQVRRFVRDVRFYIEDAEYREIGPSPYIAGPPVKTPDMFYGRQSTFSWIQENLSGAYQDNVLVLHGERRTGKTSVLYQLQYHLPETYAFVLVDLQSIAYGLGATSDLLYAMSRKIVNGLRRQGFELEPAERERFSEHPIEEFVALGERIGEQALAGGRRAVMIVDEFDLLIEAVESGAVSRYVFDCIRGLMQHQDGLSFIFAGAHKISAMLMNPQAILFNTALSLRVSFLDAENAERLIRDPVADVLWYDDLAVEKILRITAGQPYFIQYICHELVNLARRERRNFVTLRDVDRALQSTVQETTGIIRNSYMSLSLEQQMCLTSLAHITDDGRPFATMGDIAETLRQDHVTIDPRAQSEALRQLVDRDFLVERGDEARGRQYGFAMDLVRVWIEQNNEYARLLEELSQ